LNDYLDRQFSYSIKKVDDKELEGGDGSRLVLEGCDRIKLHDFIMAGITAEYAKKEELVDIEFFRLNERMIMLQVLDGLWRDHLLSMDHLKEGIGLRGYAQKNPLTEYKKEGFDLFAKMNHRMKEEIVQFLFKVQIVEGGEAVEAKQKPRKMVEHRGGDGEATKPVTVKREGDKVGRNDPCPCGSGKKYKKCHGQ
jgi:preprotein translocase subunit SecA